MLYVLERHYPETAQIFREGLQAMISSITLFLVGKAVLRKMWSTVKNYRIADTDSPNALCTLNLPIKLQPEKSGFVIHER